MPPRAMTHNLYGRPPSPCLTSSLDKRCYNFVTPKGPTWRVCCTRQVLLFTWSSSENRCSCWQETLALQRKRESMDARMAAQEHVALARSLVELYNSHQSDPAWLEKSVAAFAADFEVIDVPSGATLHGPEGYKRFLRFFLD